MKNMDNDTFANKLDIQGIFIDNENLLNIGFKIDEHTFHQKTSTKMINTHDFLFETKTVRHLNNAGLETPCPLCHMQAKDKVKCEAFNETDFSLFVIEAAMGKLEESMQTKLSR